MVIRHVLPQLSTQTEVERFWRWRLRRSDPWRGRELRYAVVDPRGYVSLRLHITTGLSEPLDRPGLACLVELWRCGLEGEHGWSIVPLLCRPGPSRPTDQDLDWAQALTDLARRAGVGLYTLHLAGDDGIRPLGLDELGLRCA